MPADLLSSYGEPRLPGDLARAALDIARRFIPYDTERRVDLHHEILRALVAVAPPGNLRDDNERLRRALAGLVDFIELDGLAMDDRAMRTALEALGWKR